MNVPRNSPRGQRLSSFVNVRAGQLQAPVRRLALSKGRRLAGASSSRRYGVEEKSPWGAGRGDARRSCTSIARRTRARAATVVDLERDSVWPDRSSVAAGEPNRVTNSVA